MFLFLKEFGAALQILMISMVPVLELRGSIIYGFGIGMPAWETVILSIIGNMIPTPFIILFVRKIFTWFEKKNILSKLIGRIKQHILDKQNVLEKYELIGLMILVAIPLPGTGAWTGAALAGLLGMRLKKSLPSIFVGVIIAAIIMTCATYGVSSMIEFFG